MVWPVLKLLARLRADLLARLRADCSGLLTALACSLAGCSGCSGCWLAGLLLPTPGSFSLVLLTYRGQQSAVLSGHWHLHSRFAPGLLSARAIDDHVSISDAVTAGAAGAVLRVFQRDVKASARWSSEEA